MRRSCSTEESLSAWRYAGKAFNLFVFPEDVEKVLTSSEFVSVKVKGREVLVRVAEGEKADLYVRTESGRSYLFYLIPADKPPGRFSIVGYKVAG
ncbi:MAG: hypothetical protein Q9N34_03360 [Aquificota bacterium]|nr:hypothetical protein [Aquificota bacterium]